jgi:hypothetical protein
MFGRLNRRRVWCCKTLLYILLISLLINHFPMLLDSKCPPALWADHERMSMEIVRLRHTAVFLDAWIIKTQLLYYLSASQTIVLKERTIFWWICYLGYLPSVLSVFKVPLSESRQESSFINPLRFQSLDLFIPTHVVLLMKPWRDSNLSELVTLSYPVAFSPIPLNDINMSRLVAIRPCEY